MAKISLDIGTKLSALALCGLLLSGCYKIEIKETLRLDGTSDLAIKMDMTGVFNALNSVTENSTVDIAGAGTLTEVVDDESATSDEPTFKSCSDPKLLEKYGAQTLEGPEEIVTLLDLEKRTSCAISTTEGMIDIKVEEVDTKTGEVVFSQTIVRKADSCEAPAIKAFYQVTDFSKPIIETYKLKKTVDISCNDNRKEIAVNTITVFENQVGSGETLTEYFNKPAPAVISNETLTELEALTKTEAENFEVCTEVEQNPDELPFFFTKCENITSGVGVFHYSKYDTTGFKINANGTVTYNLQSVTKPVNDNFSKGLENNTGDDSMAMDMNPSLLGFQMEYVLVSPWPIIEYRAGELDNGNTLRINLLALKEKVPLTVTLDTDGSTLNLVSVRTQQQIDQLILSLEEKLTTLSAPVERQVEYIYYLSDKIKRLTALKPSQQIPLGYLQTKLITLAHDLQIDPLTALEADFLSEIELLGDEVLNEEVEVDKEVQETEDTSLEADQDLEASLEVETKTPPTAQEEETKEEEEELFDKEETGESDNNPIILE